MNEPDYILKFEEPNKGLRKKQIISSKEFILKSFFHLWSGKKAKLVAESLKCHLSRCIIHFGVKW